MDTRKARVPLHLLPWADYGGTERSVLNLCRASRPAGVLILKDGPFLREFSDAGIECEALDRNDCGEARVTALLASADVLHVHCMDYTSEIEAFRQAARLPSIVTVHGRRTMPALNCPIVCVSDSVAAQQLPENECRVIPNGVDLKEFAFRERTETSSFPIVCIARPGRRGPYFMESMRAVLDAVPRVELWLVGQERANDGRVHYLGVRRDTADILAQAALFAYAPPPETGAHDNCILEAMASEVPVVSSDVSGVRESIRHKHDGILVQPGSASAFTEAVIGLIGDRTMRETLARNARASVEQRFDIRQMAGRYHAVYDAVCRDAAASRPWKSTEAQSI